MKKLLWIMSLVTVLVFFAACENPLLVIVRQTVKTTNAQQWSPSATYAVDAYALMPPLANGGPIYRSLQDNNLNHDPLTEMTWWILDDTQRY